MKTYSNPIITIRIFQNTALTAADASDVTGSDWVGKDTVAAENRRAVQYSTMKEVTGIVF